MAEHVGLEPRNRGEENGTQVAGCVPFFVV